MSSSARRALKILAAIGESGAAMGVSEIARAVGTTPGTAFRGLDALQRAHLLARHPSAQRYVLGPAALGLRQTLLAEFRIRDACLPYLRQLASLSGETASLHVRIGWYAARIAAAPGTGDVTSGANLSGVEPLASGAAGRAILAHLGDEECARYLRWVEAGGLRAPAGLKRDLAAIRARGFAQAGATGEGALAFPIRKLDQAFASIAVEGPALSAARSPAPIAEWAKIARAVETVVRANPALACQPFEHVDADQIALPS